MKRHIVSLAAAAFFALGASTVWAQPTQDGGGRPAGSGGGTGPGSVGSGGGGSAGGGSSVSSGGDGGGSTVSTSSGSTGGGSTSMGWGNPGVDFPRADAPRRGPGAAAYGDSQGRTRGGGEAQGRAVPRGTPAGGGSGGGGGEGRAVPRGEAGDRGAAGRGAGNLTVDGGGRDRQGPQRSAVPAYSRPREGRTPIGTPVDRGTATGRPGGGVGVDLPWWYYGSYYGYPYGSYGYYNRYGFYPGYGFGLGYFYDPFWSGYGGYGSPYGGGYGGYGGGGAGYYSSRGYDTGSLRLKVEPRDAKVYVDGYFVGVVDSFDGVFQKLAVEAGTHRVEVRADGFEPAQFEIMVTPGETITYKGQLKRITP